MEWIRMAFVYPHLLACCVAVGLILMTDAILAMELLGGVTESAWQREHLRELHGPITWALAVLWITGIGIVSLDVSAKGASYFLNPKLQAKIVVVISLTLNGMLLHRAVLPALQRAGSVLLLAPRPRRLALVVGVVSGVSWLYAAMLGIARPLNWKYSLLEILGAYVLLVAAGVLVVLWLANLARDLSFPRRKGFSGANPVSRLRRSVE